MCKVVLNEELKGIEISFDSIPNEEVRNNLKDCGFRWHRAKKVWYAKQNEKTIAFAKNLGEIKDDVLPTSKIKEVVNEHGWKVGDVLSASWGYDQTNVDFFQIIDIRPKMVKVRQVYLKVTSEKWLNSLACDRTYEVTNDLLEPREWSVHIQDNQEGVWRKSREKYIHVSDVAWASKYHGEVVDESWYH